MTMSIALVNTSNWSNEDVVVNVDGNDVEYTLAPGEVLPLEFNLDGERNISVQKNPGEDIRPFYLSNGNPNDNGDAIRQVFPPC